MTPPVGQVICGDCLDVVSLGAGVQSTALCLMAVKGELPMPDCAIFADTGWEPRRVYEHLDWLEAQLPFPVYRVNNGHIVNDYGNARFASMPFFLDSGGMARRQCTSEYKLKPLHRKMRELVGKGEARMWIGISLDEIHRCKPSRVKYIEHWFPLIDRSMRRADVLEWLRKNDYPEPPRSACIGCPYHSPQEWAALAPDELQQAVDFDANLRANPPARLKQVAYLHRSLHPLSKVPLQEHTDDPTFQLNLWDNECEGMCGV